MALLQLNLSTRDKRKTNWHTQVPNEDKILPFSFWSEYENILHDYVHHNSTRHILFLVSCPVCNLDGVASDALHVVVSSSNSTKVLRWIS